MIDPRRATRCTAQTAAPRTSRPPDAGLDFGGGIPRAGDSARYGADRGPPVPRGLRTRVRISAEGSHALGTARGTAQTTAPRTSRPPDACLGFGGGIPRAGDSARYGADRGPPVPRGLRTRVWISAEGSHALGTARGTAQTAALPYLAASGRVSGFRRRDPTRWGQREVWRRPRPPDAGRCTSGMCKALSDIPSRPHQPGGRRAAAQGGAKRNSGRDDAVNRLESRMGGRERTKGMRKNWSSGRHPPPPPSAALSGLAGSESGAPTQGSIRLIDEAEPMPVPALMCSGQSRLLNVCRHDAE